MVPNLFQTYIVSAEQKTVISPFHTASLWREKQSLFLPPATADCLLTASDFPTIHDSSESSRKLPQGRKSTRHETQLEMNKFRA